MAGCSQIESWNAVDVGGDNDVLVVESITPTFERNTSASAIFA